MDITITQSSSKSTLVSFLRKDIEEKLDLKVFSKNLHRFTKDWVKETSSIYTKSQKDLRQDLSLKMFADKVSLSSSSSVKLAEITLAVRSNSLASFAHSTLTETVTEAGGSGRFRVTRAATLLGKSKQVAVISRKSRSSYFASARDDLTPKFQGRIKGFTPKGHKGKIFIRLQPKTWGARKQRLPIAQMYGIPNAYLLNSKRTKTAFNFDQRLKDLWKR